VEDGSLRTGIAPGWTSLYSDTPYRNFELEFEWMIQPGGNTGVKYLARAGTLHPTFAEPFWSSFWRMNAVLLGLTLLVGLLGWLRRRQRLVRWLSPLAVVLLLAVEGWGLWRSRGIYREAGAFPPGLEFQIIDDAPSAQGLVIGVHKTGALYDLFGPRNAPPTLTGRFHSGRIVVNGSSVEHWVDGQKVLDYQLGSDRLKKAIAASKFNGIAHYGEPGEGYIELQNNGTPAWFRNVRIRRLPR
jgi:hypothetical protein